MPGSPASLSLDGEWSLVPDPARRYGPGDLPAGVPIQVPGCWEAQLDDPYGIVSAWYQRSFDAPETRPGERLALQFGAVMYACEVFVNGERIGEHEGGYTAFELDATDRIRAGQPNDLLVRVTNPMNIIREYPVFPESDVRELEQQVEALAGPGLPPLGEIPHGKQTWYSSQSGIWQSVRLGRRPAVALRPPRIRPDVGGRRAIVRWAVDAADATVPPGMPLRFELLDPDGRTVDTVEVEPRPGQTAGEAVLQLDTVRLWDIDQPDLYTVHASIAADGGVLHEVRARFGMREIATDGGRILLNGRPVYLLGALDQDLYPDTISGPPSRAFLDDQMRRTREMGINLLRCHIKVPDPAYLDAADEAGILVWCELPNWMRFTEDAARRGRQTLEDMVEQLGNHPSIVIWTIINEDWGTDVRERARDRDWLRETYGWLKELDPTRLVVDNSACEADPTPNFHVRSDLADFHVYFAAPDHVTGWRDKIAEFADRPEWLWSPHGDAIQRGDEPLVLSEFGSWGLPRPDRLIDRTGGEPWWFATGRGHFRPAGWEDRFGRSGLDAIWPTLGDLAEATQWHQFETLQYEIGELRRHDAIQGYVITELCDANWEANGLLDERRGPKAFHERLSSLNAAVVVVADLPRHDFWAGAPIEAEVTLSSYGPPSSGGRLRWWLSADGIDGPATSRPITVWPEAGARIVGRVETVAPAVDAAADAVLHVVAIDDGGIERARSDYRLAILPPLGERAGDDLLITSQLTADQVDHAQRGGRVLVLARSADAIGPQVELARPVAVHPRWRRHPDWPGGRGPWEGDWVTTWSWIRHDLLPGLPVRNPLDFAYREVLPDHVLTGFDPARHATELAAGMFAGWVHAPVGLVWTFPQGRGWLTVTTLHVAPESGPVATHLLDRLIRHAAAPLAAVHGGDGREVA